MSDSTATVQQLRDLVRDFVEQRDWRQFHAPKNLAMSLAIEAAELMEHFQWVDVPGSRAPLTSEKHREVSEELADVLCYALALANEMEIDIDTAVRQKMRKNAAKYPADTYRGRYE